MRNIFTGKPMKGFLFVDTPGVATLPGLRKWIGRAVAFVETQPPKPKRATPKRSPPRQALARAR